MKLLNWIIPILIFLILLSIFRGWISIGVLSSGDWSYLYPKAIAEIVPFSSWNSILSGGIGISALPQFWNDAYALTLIKLVKVLPWPIFERVVWFFPYLILSFAASFLLSKKIFKDLNFNLLSGLIYCANTYSLLIVSGGQVGVMMAYAFLPLVFLTLLNLFEEISFKKSVIFALALSILIILDLRVCYMFLAAELLFALIYLIYNHTKIISKIYYFFILPAIISVFINAFWILPNLLVGKNPSSEFSDIYTSAASLDFFSFAKFEDAISLFHPNWPDNFFGKTSFLPPEVLVVTILAFTILLFINFKNKKQEIILLSFILLSLISAFLAKGTNEPFGEIYRLFFNKIPGFVMFRDSTKWYMLVAVSYSVMIPLALFKFADLIKLKIKNVNFQIIVPVIFIVIWGIIIRDAILGNVGGTLSPRTIPADYQKFANFLAKDNNFSRILWVPTYDTFSYNSINHPVISGTDFLSATSSSDLIRILKSQGEQEKLQDLSIKYVAVPSDTSGRIFVTERKYDESVHQKMINEIASIKYLKPVGNYGKVKVFELYSSAGGPKAHIWGIGSSMKVSANYISPTQYSVDVVDAQKGDVFIFTDGYDKLWQINVDGQILGSQEFKISKKISYNSFILPKNGTYSLTVAYKPQEWVNMGLVISFVSLIITVFLIYKLKNEN